MNHELVELSIGFIFIKISNSLISMLNFNKDMSCKFVQSSLINHYFDISITTLI